MLGTAQWGMPYGVANRQGPPDDRELRRILSLAAEAGVRNLDTAAAYGDSEARIGQALAASGRTADFRVITKTLPLTDAQRSSSPLAAAALRASIDQSLRRLRLEQPPWVLLHREEDAAWAETLAEQQDRGRIARWGVSCGHDPASAARLLELPGLAALQVPLNALDRRHLDGGTLRAAREAGAELFLRSLLLQGLLTLAPERIPVQLPEIASAHRRFRELAQELQLSPAALAVRFALALPGRPWLLLGVESASQLEDNLAALRGGKLPEEAVRRLLRIPSPPEACLTPSRWPPGTACGPP